MDTAGLQLVADDDEINLSAFRRKLNRVAEQIDKNFADPYQVDVDSSHDGTAVVNGKMNFFGIQTGLNGVDDSLDHGTAADGRRVQLDGAVFDALQVQHIIN